VPGWRNLLAASLNLLSLGICPYDAPLPNLVTLVAFFFSVADLPLLPLLVLQAAVRLTAYVPCFFFFLCTA
jgi:hypothetical protein